MTEALFVLMIDLFTNILTLLYNQQWRWKFLKFYWFIFLLIY